MLAGLLYLGACHVADALRARAPACGWPELLGQAVDNAGNAAGILCMFLVGLAALALCAFVLWPFSVLATVVLAVRICRALARKAAP
ncbi:hypothetical protein WDL1P2_00452 (plasmid) [Variovorax sp. WDL1]|nr:hypothetical protein APY03_7133 [Variovorax sp. WDL1]PNG49151.1 hypothetical protein CHC06_06388 [Variovorax sp. B2]PNG49536.1 hypothetical protein CHC07_06445 [Variovorax sp. B4]VTV18822.1 hypothetical protein WDL1P2_00452 [Variovorax sp. WDL1]